ncbi:MAG: glycosyltransferase [Bacteroidetes bacterium]|nr:glycosyltransferase [Bacteroidota bacterium]
MTQKTEIDISIVIVNYNVKEFIAQLFDSINRSIGELTYEILLVDNNSVDNSLNYLSSKFPDVVYISNSSNIGFGKANNQAFKEAKGTYTFILNPDTLVQENTLVRLKQFLDLNQEYGAVGCKLLNPDGSFAPESRRQEPNPISALGQTIGLTKLFPNNKRWAGYYMNWLSEDKFTDVEVLSGACMFFRTSVLKELHGFDERFFMYGEDIDLCKRTRDLGYKIGYLPSTSIIHYKGESTKKDNIDYVVVFNKAMYQYFLKHYSKTYSYTFKFIIVVGIIIRGLISYIRLKVLKYWQLLLDLLILNSLIVPLFIWRYDIEYHTFFTNYKSGYLVVNLLLSSFYTLAGFQTGLYDSRKFLLGSMFKSVFLSISGTILVSFFLRDYAFSRLILVLTCAFSTFVLTIVRLFVRNTQINKTESGRIKPLRILIVGIDNRTPDIIRKIRSKVNWNYEIVGLVSQKNSIQIEQLENVTVCGSVGNLSRLCQMLKIDQVFFSSNTLSNNEIVRQMTLIGELNIHTKLISEAKEYLIGKSNVEYFDDVPILDLDLAYNNTFNVLTKRLFDIVLSIILLIVFSPLAPFLYLKVINSKNNDTIDLNGENVSILSPYKTFKWYNRYQLLIQILRGSMSFIGAPLIRDGEEAPIKYKKGLTGLRQINEHRLFRIEEKHQYELHYLKFYSIWMDFDILIKQLFNLKNKS